MFRLKSGKVKTLLLPVTPSTVIAEGALVTTTSGLLVAATSSTAANALVGVLKKAIAATDSDYATSRSVEVIVPMEKNCIFEFDVTASLVAADVGLLIDLTDSVTANRAASSTDIIRVTKLISTTKGQGIVQFTG